ncbi:MAG: RNA-binding protein [Acidobacteriota bacterium]
MRTLYVGGLPPAADDIVLRGMFEDFGSVTEARIVRSLETGASRGFGYVTFDSELSAHKARKTLDGQDNLRVAMAS